MPRATRPKARVTPDASRRTFSAAYKARILTQAAACTPAERGALLRREGLYSSHLAKWRAGHAPRDVDAPAPAPAGRPPVSERERVLERELALARRDLTRAELLLTIETKTAELLRLELSPLSEERPRGRPPLQTRPSPDAPPPTPRPTVPARAAGRARPANRRRTARRVA
jgi:transposase